MTPAEPGTDCPGASQSSCHVTLLSGSAVTVWARGAATAATPQADCDTSVLDPAAATARRVELCLEPERVVVVGRADGRHDVPYLDPAYVPTRIVPDTGQSVLVGDREEDNTVSRGHFTLRGGAGGAIVLTNGVPRRGGGVRPPKNGTKLVAPDVRPLDPGEELRIEPGAAAVIRLPNACEVEIAAR